MSKVKKNNIKSPTSTKPQQVDEHFAFKTVIFSALLGCLFLVFSILFNAEIVTFFMIQGGLWSIIDIVLKVFIILLFFFFILVSIGNYKELTGKPLKLKEVLFIFIISIIQSFRNPVVFAFTFFGLIILSIYLYLVQES